MTLGNRNCGSGNVQLNLASQKNSSSLGGVAWGGKETEHSSFFYDLNPA